jgi:hypothetical protein
MSQMSGAMSVFSGENDKPKCWRETVGALISGLMIARREKRKAALEGPIFRIAFATRDGAAA